MRAWRCILEKNKDDKKIIRGTQGAHRNDVTTRLWFVRRDFGKYDRNKKKRKWTPTAVWHAEGNKILHKHQIVTQTNTQKYKHKAHTQTSEHTDTRTKRSTQNWGQDSRQAAVQTTSAKKRPQILIRHFYIAVKPATVKYNDRYAGSR